MAAPLEPVPSTEPGVYRFKTNLTMAGGWAVVARRQGPGRDRHGREQADRQGAPMRRARQRVWQPSRPSWPRREPAVGAGQTGLLRLPSIHRIGRATGRSRRRPRSVIYYQDPDGKPFYSLTPKKTPTTGEPYVAVHASEDVSFDDKRDAKSRRQQARTEDQILPQPDGPARHLAGAEEGLDGDGLHPRLRGRGQDDGTVKVSPARSSAPA